MKVIDGAALTALESGRFGVRALVLFDLPSGRWGIFDDQYTLTHDGDTYVGAAGRFTVQIPPAASDMSVRGLTVTLSGLDGAALAWVQDQSYRQRPMFASLAVLSDTGAILAVRKWFSGFVDTVQWQERPDGQARLVVRCESASRELDRSGARTRSDADQRAMDPDDKFFEHTIGSISTEYEWGQVPPTAPAKKKWWQIF